MRAARRVKLIRPAFAAGVDPGGSVGSGTGIAWIAGDEHGSCTVRRTRKETLGEYLTRLRDELQGILPVPATGCVVAAERPMVGRFPGVGMGIARVVGVVEEITACMGARYLGITPKTLKATYGVTKAGKAGKDEMTEIMRGYGYAPANEHEADAYALARMAWKAGG